MTNTGQACSQCNAPLFAGALACAYCGAPTGDFSTLEEQQRALANFHAALATAVAAAGKDTDAVADVRARFLGHAFVPSFASLLVEEAVRCEQLFTDLGSSKPARARMRACITRLELLALNDAGVRDELAILARRLEVEDARQKKEEIEGLRFFYGLIGVLLALAIAVVWALARR